MTTLTCCTIRTPHRQAANEIGYDHGYTHAAFTDAYGGDPYAEPDVPAPFADVPTCYTTAYADGVNAYFDDAQEF